MHTLCFLSNLTSAEWAAWVQAIGSIGAIIGAAWIAIHQAKLQHRNALDLHRTEQREARMDVGNAIAVLATNASKAMKHISTQLDDRDAVHRVADGEAHCDIAEVARIDTYVAAIPLHTLPAALVTLTMVLGSTVRQFKDKVQMAIRLHRKMDADMFTDFFKTIAEMNGSVESTCADIHDQVKKLAEA